MNVCRSAIGTDGPVLFANEERYPGVIIRRRLACTDQGPPANAYFADPAVIAQFRQFTKSLCSAANRKTARWPGETSMKEATPAASGKAAKAVTRERSADHAASLRGTPIPLERMA